MSNQNGLTSMLHLFTGLDLYTGLFLVLALVFVLAYEAINGFHDTANAVATVIYTRAMRAQFAVVMAGVFNFFGVLLGAECCLCNCSSLTHRSATQRELCSRACDGVLTIAGCYYLEFRNVVFRLAGIQFTYADWCDYRGWLSQCGSD